MGVGTRFAWRGVGWGGEWYGEVGMDSSMRRGGIGWFYYQLSLLCVLVSRCVCVCVCITISSCAPNWDNCFGVLEPLMGQMERYACVCVCVLCGLRCWYKKSAPAKSARLWK